MLQTKGEFLQTQTHDSLGANKAKGRLALQRLKCEKKILRAWTIPVKMTQLSHMPIIPIAGRLRQEDFEL